MTALLETAELAELARELPHWQVGPQALRREWRFADFSAAWGFLSRVALLAEAQGHHPDWSNSYNIVKIALATHDAGGVTSRDATLARAIDALRQRASGGGAERPEA